MKDLTMLKMGKFLMIPALLAAGPALAAFDIEELQTATKTSLTMLTAAEPTHAPHITGFKTWKSNDDAKVKVYVDHSGMSMEFSYVCHKHTAGIECHAQ